MTDARLAYGIYQQHMRPFVHKSALAGLALCCRCLYAGRYAAHRSTCEDEKPAMLPTYQRADPEVPWVCTKQELSTAEAILIPPIVEGRKAFTLPLHVFFCAISSEKQQQGQTGRWEIVLLWAYWCCLSGFACI